MEKQIIRRICDYCKTKQDFDTQNLRPEDEKSMGEWVVLGRGIVINGQSIPFVKHACRKQCAQNLLSTGQFEVPEFKRPEPPVQEPDSVIAMGEHVSKLDALKRAAEESE